MSSESGRETIDQKDDQSETSDFIEVNSDDAIDEPPSAVTKLVADEPVRPRSPPEEPEEPEEPARSYATASQNRPVPQTQPQQTLTDPLTTKEHYAEPIQPYRDEEAAVGEPMFPINHPLQNLEPYFPGGNYRNVGGDGINDDDDDEILEAYDDDYESKDRYEEERLPAPELDAQPVDPNERGHVKGFKNARDHTEMVELAVIGEFPKWLKGELFTVGPGTYDINYGRKIMVDGELEMATVTFRFEHWFDALPLVNRFDFEGSNNQIVYRSRLPFKRLVSKIRDHHGYQPTHAAGLFKTDTNQSFLAKFLKPVGKASKPDLEPCSACVHTQIPGIQGRLFAQNNATQVVELDPVDLTPTNHFSWNELNPAFRGHQASPHGQYDPATGEWINFTMEIGIQGATYHFFSITEANPKGSVISSVQAKASFVHSFALTPRYIILAVFPFHANYRGVQFTWHESILDSFSFRNEPTLFYVISRQKRQHVATYRADACFAFHHVNAFEDIVDGIHLDIACYNSATIANQLTTSNLRHPESMEPPHLEMAEIRRYTLPQVTQEMSNFERHNSRDSGGIFGGLSKMISGVVASESGEQYSWIPIATCKNILNCTIELPQVNPAWRLSRNRYLFGLGMATSDVLEPGLIWNSIVKADLDKGTITHAWSQEGCFPSEALLIPAPAQKDPTTQLPKHVDEDDGVLVSVVLDSINNKSFILILDSKTFKEVATADLPQVVPLSFAHGSFRCR